MSEQQQLEIQSHPKKMVLGVGMILIATGFALLAQLGELSLARFNTLWRAVIQAADFPYLGHQRLLYTWLIFLALASGARIKIEIFPVKLRSWNFSIGFLFLSSLVLVLSQRLWTHSAPGSWTFWIWLSSEVFFMSALVRCVSFFLKDPIALLQRALFAFFSAMVVIYISRLSWAQYTGFSQYTFRALLFCLNAVTQVRITNVHEIYHYSTIQVGQFAGRVLGPCSGLEGIVAGTTSLMAAIFLFRQQLRFPRVLILIPFSAVLFWFANVFRLWILFLMAGFVSKEMALRGFHINAGWLFFQFVSIFLAVITFQTPWFSKNRQPILKLNELWKSPTAVYLTPLMVLIFVGLLTASFNYRPIDPLYLLKIFAGGSLFLILKKKYSDHYQSLSQFVSLTPRALGVGFVIFSLWMLSQMLFPPQVEAREMNPLLMEPTMGWLWLILWAIGSSTIVPLVEEIAFRGYLMRRIFNGVDFQCRPLSQVSFLSVIGSSLLFGLAHGQIFGAFLAGVILAELVRRENRIGGAVVAHGTANFLIFLWVVTQKQWDWI